MLAGASRNAAFYHVVGRVAWPEFVARNLPYLKLEGVF